MDVEFKRFLVEMSIKTARESSNESIRDIFLRQANRIESEIEKYLKENPECTSVKAAEESQEQEKDSRRSSRTGERKRTRTRSAKARR